MTELRAAVHNSADGKRLTVDPVLLRAHLARLLREIGSNDEARAEAEAVWQLSRPILTAPNQSLADNPSALEIRAARRRGDRRRPKGCRDLRAPCIDLKLKSVGMFDPNTITWLRDWWVGRAYARCLLRTSQASETVTALERYVSQPDAGSSARADVRSSRVLLAFLLDGQGKAKLAESQWSALSAKPKLEAAVAPQPAAPAAVDIKGADQLTKNGPSRVS